MKRYFLTACAGLMAAAVASPSFAADMPRPAYKAPVSYVAPFSWSGFYVGLNVGYGWGTATASNLLFSESITTKGAVAGGTLGYNVQTGSWVWGVEGDFDWSGIKGSDAFGFEARNRWLATTRGRIGYAWDRFLPYFTGGAAFGDERVTNPAGLSESKTKVGWTLGGGLEYAFMGAWSAKIEYLYVDLGKWTCSTITCGGLATDIGFKTNLIRGGINYRF